MVVWRCSPHIDEHMLLVQPIPLAPHMLLLSSHRAEASGKAFPHYLGVINYYSGVQYSILQYSHDVQQKV